MQVPLAFKFWSYGLKFEEIADSMDLSGPDKPDPEKLCCFLARNSAVPFDELLAHPEGVRPAMEPCFVQPAPVASGRLELMPSDVAAELKTVLSDEEDTRFAYRLISRRVLHTLNGAFRNSHEASRRYPVNWAYMNRQDMAHEGLKDGDAVAIASSAGKIQSVAKAEDRLRPGVISMTHLFGPLESSEDPSADGGANVGQLTSLESVLEPINFMPRFTGIPVNLTRV
jgi:anaerobic selenocysteine-containing dehydrogenase